jgi:hypothetical protein
MISVILCTHNPRKDYLRRVLEALKSQTLPLGQWELLLIDNASSERLADVWDLSWHPKGRIVREEEIGLTAARLCGIKESAGELLVFVDDDNVVAQNYLSMGITIAEQWPMLGAFGASISPEFEGPAPSWILPHLEALAVRELDRDYWGNLGGLTPALPCGAGLWVRRRVAQDYFEKATANAFRKMLGRSGASLGAGEDSDLAECAIDIGLGTGRFVALKLVHLIPKGRLTPECIIRLNAGFAASHEILSLLRPKSRYPTLQGWKDEIRLLVNYAKASPLQKKILLASHRARKKTRRLISAVRPVV